MKVFNAICLAALLDHHGEGFEKAHPDYVREKIAYFERCSEDYAMAALDSENQARVAKWMKNWDYDSWKKWLEAPSAFKQG